MLNKFWLLMLTIMCYFSQIKNIPASDEVFDIPSLTALETLIAQLKIRESHALEQKNKLNIKLQKLTCINDTYFKKNKEDMNKWRNDRELQKKYWEEVKSEFINLVRKKAKDIAGFDLCKVFEQYTMEELYHLEPSCSFYEVMDIAEKRVEAHIQQEFISREKEYSLYKVGQNVTVFTHLYGTTTGRLIRIIPGMSIRIGPRNIQMDDLPFESRARFDKDENNKLQDDIKRIIIQETHSNRLLEKSTCLCALEKGFCPNLKRDYHFDIDHVDKKVLNSSFWITYKQCADMFCPNITQKHLVLFYKSMGLESITDDKFREIWVTPSIKKDWLSFRDELVKYQESLEEISQMCTAKKQLERQAVKEYEEAHRQYVFRKNMYANKQNQQILQGAAERQRRLDADLENNPYYKICYVVNYWLAAQRDGKPSSQCCHDAFLGEKLCSVQSWKIYSQKKDFDIQMDMYSVVVGIDSSNEAGVPMTPVKWNIIVSTHNGKNWKIDFISRL